ncbi:CDP-alcohol phosphatidyltransferase family protein [Thermodesulfobacteriota bacterium]
MPEKLHLPQKVTTILVYGRPPLVFGGLLCAIAVMWLRSPAVYTLGVLLFFISMTFDLVDGWFAARFRPELKLAHLADRIMDKVVYSIIFPLVAVGMMWRLHFSTSTQPSRELLHVIFVLILCVTVLFRDNFAGFMRSFAISRGQEPEPSEFTRLRTTVAAPVGALLYAYAFYVPQGAPSLFYNLFSRIGNLPLHVLFFIEILFLIINFGSIARYCKKYGTYCLDELCLGDDVLRKKILAFFPNALTVMNAMMGLLAVFFAYHGQIPESYLVLLGAALFDKLDGAWARKLGVAESSPPTGPQSPTLGGILDDISDAVSFCIAPAWIYYICMINSGFQGLGPVPAWLIAFFYAGMGIIRLIYFTIDKTPIPGFFKGLPTPASALLVVAPLIMFTEAANEASGFANFWMVFASFLMILAAIVMNLYPIHYIHMGRLMGRHPWFARATILLALVFVFTPYFGYIGLTYLFMYLLSPLLSWRIEPEQAAREARTKAFTTP